MKKNPRLEERRKKISKDIDIFVDKSYDLSARIHEILKKNGKEQKYLAEKLNKSESEISKWLTGTHNFTLRTLALIESVLKDEVFIVAGKEKIKEEVKVIYVFSDTTKIAAKKASSNVNITGEISLSINAFQTKCEAIA